MAGGTERDDSVDKQITWGGGRLQEDGRGGNGKGARDMWAKRK